MAEKNAKFMPQQWKTPNEIIRLQRLKQKHKALQARIERPTKNATSKLKDPIEPTLAAAKRRNPFAQNVANEAKRPKICTDEIDLNKEDSVFMLLAKPIIDPTSNATTDKTTDFNRLLKQQAEEETVKFEQQKQSEYAPIDWSLKTKLRVISEAQLPGNFLKTIQEASAVTSFVRCIDPTLSASTELDMSLGARFHQATLYWQHPNLPWLTLFPRNLKTNTNFNLGEAERTALAKDWTNSLGALFQLLCARQCPYFYVCANSFTVLFRAAGIGGRGETHAFITPTSRGMRAALKQEEIEFTMPLKSDAQNRSFDSETDVQNSSLSNSTDEGNCSATADDDGGDNNDEEEEDQEEWLASLGVDASEIKKINSVQDRIVRNAECEEDFSDRSLVLVEGIECQAFYNFLLNSKSATTKVGKLAGIPPTLLAPVSFSGATLRSLQVRHSTVPTNNVDYQKIELRGVILPHILPYLCMLLKETKETFSISMTTQKETLSFSKAAQKLMADLNKENNGTASGDVFGRENLSDCGLLPQIVESFCRIDKDAIRNLDCICYNKVLNGYLWSE